jgi:ABC-type transporter MlaC component
MRGVVSGVLDLQTLGQGAMVTHWNALGKTPKLKKMRDKYMSLFQQLIEENYMEQARKYIGGKYQITFTSEDTQSKKPMVKAKIKKTDVDVLVEFDVLKQKDVWKVQDIRLDTTSLEATYRSSFNRLIKKKGGLDSGFPELLKSMEKRLAELRSGKAESL